MAGSVIPNNAVTVAEAATAFKSLFLYGQTRQMRRPLEKSSLHQQTLANFAVLFERHH